MGAFVSKGRIFVEEMPYRLSRSGMFWSVVVGESDWI